MFSSSRASQNARENRRPAAGATCRLGWKQRHHRNGIDAAKQRRFMSICMRCVLVPVENDNSERRLTSVGLQSSSSDTHRLCESNVASFRHRSLQSKIPWR